MKVGGPEGHNPRLRRLLGRAGDRSGLGALRPGRAQEPPPALLAACRESRPFGGRVIAIRRTRSHFHWLRMCIVVVPGVTKLSAQLLSLTPMAHWLEYCDWWNPILAAPLRVEQGLSRIEGVIGTGVDWDEAAVQRCLA